MEQDNNEDFLYRIPRRQRKRLNYEYGAFAPFEVTAERSSAMHFNVYLYGPIEDASQFIGAQEVFRAAGPDDVVEVHLSTPGGSMDATDTFLQAMHECEGRVIIRASGGVHSCGSIILLHASEFTLSPNFNMLVHNGSTGMGGDLNKFAAAAKHSVEYMNRVLRDVYEGFLTKEELQAMIDGKDFWVDGKEFMRRWNLRQEHFKAKMQAQQQLEAAEVTPRPARNRKKQQVAA